MKFKNLIAKGNLTPSFRRLLLVGGLASVLWIVAAWFITDHNHDRQAVEAIAAEASEARRLDESIAAGIGSLLALRGGIAATLAEDEFIRQTVISLGTRAASAAPDAGERRQRLVEHPSLKPLNRFLATAAGHLKLSGLWLGDAAGYAIAADNPAAQETPIGVNFADRRYFREARAGRIGYQYAFGRTTRVGGIFFSAPIMDGERFAGFVAVKINVAVLSAWVDQADAMLSDSHGVVILAKDKRLEMRTLPGASVAKLSNAERQQLYARTEFPELSIVPWGDSHYPALQKLDNGATPVLLQSRALPEFGLGLTLMRPVAGLAVIDQQRNQLFLLLAGIGLLLIVGISVSMGYLERGMMERSAQLEAANKELEEFSYAVSHDLRSPLRAIAGFARIMEEDYGPRLDDEGRRLLGVVRENGQRMGRLIDGILDYLHLSRQVMHPKRLDMAVLARESFAKAAPVGRAINFEVAPLPPARGDEALIREMLTQLLSNAIKFTAPKAEAKIEVDGIAGEEESTYVIRDNGIGFDMRYANKLFRVFEHLHSESELEGTGIGLAMVKRIVHRHGGRVWAEGREGEGASIYFTLPHQKI